MKNSREAGYDKLIFYNHFLIATCGIKARFPELISKILAPLATYVRQNAKNSKKEIKKKLLVDFACITTKKSVHRLNYRTAEKTFWESLDYAN